FPKIFRLSSTGVITSIADVLSEVPLIRGIDGEVYGLTKANAFSLFQVRPEGGVTVMGGFASTLLPPSSTIWSMTQGADGSFTFSASSYVSATTMGALYRWVPGENPTQIEGSASAGSIYSLVAGPDGSIFGCRADYSGSQTFFVFLM